MNVPDNRQLLSHPFTSSTRSLQLQRHKFGVIWNEIYISQNKYKLFRDKFTSGLNVQDAWWHTRRMSTVLFINLINNTAGGEGWRRFFILSVVLCHDRPSSCTTQWWATGYCPAHHRYAMIHFLLRLFFTSTVPSMNPGFSSVSAGSTSHRHESPPSADQRVRELGCRS